MPPVVAAAAAFSAWGATSLGAAIVVGAVKGAIVGALIGAASAAVTGGNIGKGALTGALVGGVTGGVMSGFSYAPVSTPPLSAPPTSAVPPSTSVATPPAMPGNAAINMPTQTASVESLQAASQAADLAAASQSKIYAGIGEGLAQGTGQVGGAMIQSREARKQSEKELEAAKAMESQSFAREQERIAGNIPGQFKAEVANVEVSEWWNRHLADSRVNRGLLNPIAQPQEVAV